MAINKKLIHFKTKQKFNEELAKGNILETSIVFILDSKEIYTHGLLYDGSKVDLSNIEASILNIIDNYATKTEIPIKVSQLENDSNYILDDVISDGVYAVTADDNLIDYNTADSTATGVALVAGEHKFMIAKADKTDGTSTTLYWGYKLYDKDVAGITDISTGSGYIGEGLKYGTDFTTWSTGPVVDFNGKDNTAAIIAGYTEYGVSMYDRDMCTVLNTFNASDSFKDWYVPACGQLALMYLNLTEINAALAKIGGTALANDRYWSSSENSSYSGWVVVFDNGQILINGKSNAGGRVRFIRDISVPKPLKERVSDLESSKQDKLVSGTNIKTINGESILGSGDIVIEGGAYAEVNHGTGDTTFTLTPNTFHVWDEIVSLDLSLDNEVENIANEYIFQFDSGLNTSLALPDSIIWYNNTLPVINSYKTYLFSILNNYGCFLEFDTVPANIITVESDGSSIQAYSTYPIKTNIYIHLENGSTLLLVKDLDNWNLSKGSLQGGKYDITLSFDSQYNETNIIKDDYYCYSLKQSVLIIPYID